MRHLGDRFAESRPGSPGLGQAHQRVGSPAEVQPVGDDRERKSANAAIVEKESEVRRTHFDLSDQHGAESAAGLAAEPEGDAGIRSRDCWDGGEAQDAPPQPFADLLQLFSELLGRSGQRMDDKLERDVDGLRHGDRRSLPAKLPMRFFDQRRFHNFDFRRKKFKKNQREDDFS